MEKEQATMAPVCGKSRSRARVRTEWPKLEGGSQRGGKEGELELI